jgi:hypothetical protein
MLESVTAGRSVAIGASAASLPEECVNPIKTPTRLGSVPRLVLPKTHDRIERRRTKKAGLPSSGIAIGFNAGEERRIMGGA